jgi:HEAT repeat protein
MNCSRIETSMHSLQQHGSADPRIGRPASGRANWSLFCALSCAATMLIACENAGPRTGNGLTSEQVWSTRDRSIAGRMASPNDPLGEYTIPVTFDQRSVRQSAIEVLHHAAESTNPLLRANALEAIHYAPESALPAVQRALGDPNRGVRFIAAMTVGDLALCDLSSLVRPLLLDDADSVRAAAIYALDRCGEAPDHSPLATMLFSDDPEVRANAAVVLGRLGNRTAIPMLRSAVGRELPRVPAERIRIVDLQIAEALVKLGDERQLDVIRAALFAPVAEQGEIVALACQLTGRLEDRRALTNLRDMATREGQRQLPTEIRLAAAEAIARIDQSAAPIAVALFHADSERFDHRAQAAITLGAMDHPAALEALKQLLTDSNPLVQIAAAGGLLQHLGPEGQHLSRER